MTLTLTRVNPMSLTRINPMTATTMDRRVISRDGGIHIEQLNVLPR